MEIMPTSLGQALSLGQPAPEPGLASGGFSEALSEAGGQSNGPPGLGSPPGNIVPGEGVETPEPNAQSQGPDFHPDIKPENLGWPLTLMEGGVELDLVELYDLEVSPPTFAPPLIAGSLAMQVVPQLVPDIPLPGGEGEPAVQLGAPERPGLYIAMSANATPMPAVGGPELTLVQDQSAQLANPPQPAKPVADTQAWASTQLRGLDDLALAERSQDVVSVRAVATAPRGLPGETVQTVDMFFDPETISPPPVPITPPVADAPSPDQMPETTVKGVANIPEHSRGEALQNVAAPMVARFGAESPVSSRTEGGVPAVGEPKAVTTPATTRSATGESSQQDGQSEPETQHAETRDRAGAEVGNSPATPKPEAARATRPVAAEKPRLVSVASEANTGREPVQVAPESRMHIGPTPQAASIAEVATASNPVREPLTVVETAEVIRQIVDRAEVLAASKPREGVVIHLEPRDLGSVTLVVKASGNEVDARIVASNDHVRNALDQSRAQLGHAMEQRGLTLGAVTVSGQANSHDYAQPQHHPRQQDGQPQQHGQHDGRDPGRQSSAQSRLDRRNYQATDGVDIWT